MYNQPLNDESLEAIKTLTVVTEGNNKKKKDKKKKKGEEILSTNTGKKGKKLSKDASATADGVQV
jgi:Zn/Cd-binding protein ZinT